MEVGLARGVAFGIRWAGLSVGGASETSVHGSWGDDPQEGVAGASIRPTGRDIIP